MLPSSPQPRPLEASPGRPLYFGGMAQPPSRAVALRYLQGDCGHLALAFHALMPGSQLWEVGVGHFAVEDTQGQFWDVRGCMNLAQVWNGMSGPRMTPMTRDEVIGALNTGVYGDGRFIPSRETAARRLIRDHVPHLDEPMRRVRRRRTP